MDWKNTRTFFLEDSELQLAIGFIKAITFFPTITYVHVII